MVFGCVVVGIVLAVPILANQRNNYSASVAFFPTRVDHAVLNSGRVAGVQNIFYVFVFHFLFYYYFSFLVFFL